MLGRATCTVDCNLIIYCDGIALYLLLEFAAHSVQIMIDNGILITIEADKVGV